MTEVFLIKLIFVLFLICAASPAQAFKTVARTLDEQVKEAKQIVHARLERVDEVRDPQTHVAYLHYRFKVLQVIKGVVAAPEIIHRQLNSKISTRHVMNVTGLPNFGLHEEVVLFLGEESQAGYPVLLGYDQGVYHIFRDHDVAYVRRSRLGGTSAANLMTENPHGANSQRLPLGQFIKHIESQL